MIVHIHFSGGVVPCTRYSISSDRVLHPSNRKGCHSPYLRSPDLTRPPPDISPNSQSLNTNAPPIPRQLNTVWVVWAPPLWSLDPQLHRSRRPSLLLAHYQIAPKRATVSLFPCPYKIRTHIISPLTRYSPRGISSTPSSMLYTRSLESDRTTFDFWS